MFWGLTPALDLQEEIKANHTELNILLIGGADCRHVLKTVARKYRHEKRKINFYIMELIMESIAKQLLITYIAFQPNEDMGLLSKTRTFMELYGNTLIRPSSAKYLKTLSAEMVKLITNYDYMKEVLPCVNVDVKFKDRDYLENIFKFWYSKDEFNICTAWDNRLRKSLGVRYDAKDGVFDWDLHMRLYQMDGNRICVQEYKHWRNTGVAFTWIESEVSMANRSLVNGVVPYGDKCGHYGYLGDMSTGPFITFGLDCEDEVFLKTKQGKNAHRATDITERNLMQIFHELENSANYQHVKLGEHELGAGTFLMSELKVLDFGTIDGVLKKTVKCFQVDDVTINFIGMDTLKLMKYKEKWRDFFNLVYCGSTYYKFLDDDLLNNVCRKEALLIVEHQKFVVSSRKDDLKEHEYNVREKVENVKCKVEIPFDVTKDCYIKWIVNTE